MEDTRKNQQAARCYRIVVAIDFSEASELALGDAIRLAGGSPRPELHVVTVADLASAVSRPRDGDPAAALDEIVSSERLALERALATAGVEGPSLPSFVHVRVGNAAQEIVALAAEIDADLIVVGTHGRSGWQRLWLGSVAERVLRLAHCPVLVTRSRQHPVETEAVAPEPPCAQCVAIRNESGGKRWWCDRHGHPHQRAHGYAYSNRFDAASFKVW